jgi:hypothetical protein
MITTVDPLQILRAGLIVFLVIIGLCACVIVWCGLFIAWLWLKRQVRASRMNRTS